MLVAQKIDKVPPGNGFKNQPGTISGSRYGYQIWYQIWYPDLVPDLVPDMVYTSYGTGSGIRSGTISGTISRTKFDLRSGVRSGTRYGIISGTGSIHMNQSRGPPGRLIGGLGGGGCPRNLYVQCGRFGLLKSVGWATLVFMGAVFIGMYWISAMQRLWKGSGC